ncbi:hypothetical protein [Hymenobacter pini]|uniref:hypothetical protein n=1 Tax=Hymenobacter pini TaxID=2880879 RepID=UPI001CF46770|nr:hypothetical protein [Hymenobacter pini]MCA8830288.1 hypothetical protein [Hymenobacter pini]
MKSFVQKITAVAFFAGLSTATSLHAQNTISGAVQQGNGAYIQKNERTECITNALLGIPGISCLNMTQEKLLGTPSGNIMSVWVGTVPAASRPSKRVVYNSTWQETTTDGVARSFNTVAVTEPSGTVKLTLTNKENGKGKPAKVK